MRSHLRRGKSDPLDGFSEANMKKVLEKETAAKSNNVTIEGIRVGETSRAKIYFWLEVLEISEKTDSDEIWSNTEGIREAMRWECPVDKNSIKFYFNTYQVFSFLIIIIIKSQINIFNNPSLTKFFLCISHFMTSPSIYHSTFLIFLFELISSYRYFKSKTKCINFHDKRLA